jgi:hypothetical protein
MDEALSNITMAQANELRLEISRLNGELHTARTELRRTQSELDERPRLYEIERKTSQDNRVHHGRLQEELLAARERNIVLRGKLLAIHRALDEE